MSAERDAGGPWAVRLRRDDVRAAGELRLCSDVELCEVGDDLWLRGPRRDEALDRLIRILPAERWELVDDERLTRPGERVPSSRLPFGDWVPLAQWLQPELGPAALAGELGRRVPLRLVRSSLEREPSVLLTELRAFVAWAVTAPAARLSRLRFAADREGRVLVAGRPLPPLAGERLYEAHGVAVPCGFAHSPQVEPAVMARVLGLAVGDLGVFHTDGSWEHVLAGQLVRASRSAARLTEEGLRDG